LPFSPPEIAQRLETLVEHALIDFTKSGAICTLVHRSER